MSSSLRRARFRGALRNTVLLGSLTNASATWAQTPAATGDAPLAPDESAAAGEAAEGAGETSSDGELSEVVVTVDRRKKDLQRYSGTASAFSEKRLTQVGIGDVTELSTVVPGLQIGVAEGNAQVYIRGVGNDNDTETGQMGIAVHLDGVYLPRPRGLGAMFYDVERVEVNSGPQGTVRGRNALGGSINIVTNKPQLGEFGANVEATFGTFSDRRYQGMVNVPIGDTLALRVAGITTVHDPYWQNGGPIYDLKAGESEDTYGLRAQIKWQPVKALSIVAGYDLVAERSTGSLGSNINGALVHEDDNGTPLDMTDDIPDPISPEQIDYPRDIYLYGVQASLDSKHQGARLEASYDLGPVILEAVASRRDLVFKQVNGGSAGVIYPGFDFRNINTDSWGSVYWDTRSQSTIGEIRAMAPDTARLRWTAGAFGMYEEQQVVLYISSDYVGGFGGLEFNMPDVSGSSYAGYADATFDVTPSFRVLGGARLTTESQSRHNGLALIAVGFNGNNSRFGTEGFRPTYRDRQSYVLPPNSTAEQRVNLFLDGIASFGARDTLPQELCNDPPTAAPGQVQQPRVAPDPATGSLRCTAGVDDALVAGNGFNISAVPQNSDVSNAFLDYRLGAEYDVAPDSLLYLTLSTAHKTGGYNDTAVRPDGVGLSNEYYGPESLTSLELGSKNELLGRRFRVNASAFFYFYRDQVLQQVFEVAPGNMDADVDPQATTLRQNAADPNVYGLDLDLAYALPGGLTAELHALLLDARYGKRTLVTDSRVGVANYQVDIDGHWLVRASPFVLNYALSQLIFTPQGSFNWLVQGQTVGKHYMSVYNGEGTLLPEATGNEPMPGSSALYDELRVDAGRLTDVIPTYTRFDLGGGWTHPDGRISINGYVSNVFNIAYATSITAGGNFNLRFYNPPRTAGVRFRVAW